MQSETTKKQPLPFKTGEWVRLVNRADLFSSIIADGNEVKFGICK